MNLAQIMEVVKEMCQNLYSINSDIYRKLEQGSVEKMSDYMTHRMGLECDLRSNHIELILYDIAQKLFLQPSGHEIQ